MGLVSYILGRPEPTFGYREPGPPPSHQRHQGGWRGASAQTSLSTGPRLLLPHVPWGPTLDASPARRVLVYALNFRKKILYGVRKKATHHHTDQLRLCTFFPDLVRIGPPAPQLRGGAQEGPLPAGPPSLAQRGQVPGAGFRAASGYRRPRPVTHPPPAPPAGPRCLLRVPRERAGWGEPNGAGRAPRGGPGSCVAAGWDRATVPGSAATVPESRPRLPVSARPRPPPAGPRRPQPPAALCSARGAPGARNGRAPASDLLSEGHGVRID